MSMNATSPFWSAAYARSPSTRKMAHALIELAPSQLKLEIVEIGQLPTTIRIWKRQILPSNGSHFALRFALSMAWSL